MDKIIKEFEEKFTRHEVMGSTLNDGSRMRFNRTPQEAIAFITSSLTSLKKELLEGVGEDKKTKPVSSSLPSCIKCGFNNDHQICACSYNTTKAEDREIINNIIK